MSSGTCCNGSWNFFSIIFGHFLTIVPSLSSSCQDFFIAEGDGLPKGVVENAAAPVQQILNLYSLDVSFSTFHSTSLYSFSRPTSVFKIVSKISTDLRKTVIVFFCRPTRSLKPSSDQVSKWQQGQTQLEQDRHDLRLMQIPYYVFCVIESTQLLLNS